MIKRIIQHTLCSCSVLKGERKKELSKKIISAIKDSEELHRGEIKIVIDASLSLFDLFSNTTSRQKALKYFSDYHIWDTEENTGILVYFLLADKKVEIVADRGIYKRVNLKKWNNLAEQITKKMKTGSLISASVFAIEKSSEILAQFFPSLKDNPNEISDKPIIS